MPSNYRIHSLLPDGYRFIEYAYKNWAEIFNLEIIELKCIFRKISYFNINLYIFLY